MEPIEKGAVSGTLPNLECFAVHYPGYPASTSRAIETLGGLKEIGKTRSFAAHRLENRNDNRLELRFRPEDPYCHPAFGDLRPCCGLLLRITKKRRNTKKKRKIDEEGEEVSANLSCSIVARVNDAYYFDGLADYQFIVPVHAAKSRQAKSGGDEAVAPISNGGMMDMEQDEMFLLVPKLFSTRDTPNEILLKSSSGAIPKDSQMHLAESNWEMSISPCLKLSYKIEEVPKKVHWEEHIPIDSPEWECQMAISKLFDERPIWPRWSMLERLLDDDIPVSYNLLRRLLPRSGYYFATGPFGQFWITRGYDPRVHPESRIYQRVDFRLRDLLPNYREASANPKTKQRWKDICKFQTFPKKSCTLQLFELDDDFIQEKIKEVPWLPRCVHSTGWFSKPTFELLSLHVKIKFLTVFPQNGNRKLLKSLRERFEKMKWLEAHNKEQGHDENNIKYLPPAVADSDEEVEEEEYDGDNGDCSLTVIPDIIGDNMNNNFLQELLGNKIIDEHGNADTGSDGEYQIYEQESNDDDNDY